MVVALILLALLIAAAVAGYTGHGVTDSRDREFSLFRRHTPHTR